MDRFDLDAGLPPDIVLELTDDETEQIRDRCRNLAARLGRADLDSPEALAGAEALGCALPARLLRDLMEFRCAGNPYGTVAVRNLPVDVELPDTPADGDVGDWRAVPVATLAQLAVMSRLGDVIAYADEKQGRLVQDVAPATGAAHRQENSGTILLELHTEDGFHPYKPDFVSLLCLRPDHDRTGRTITGAVPRLLPRLSPACVDTLRRPLFRIRFSDSFAAGGSTGLSAPIPVLTGPERDPEVVADFHAMRPLTEAAGRALAELEAVLTRSLLRVVPEPGTMLIVDNRVAVHGRTAFTARYDGTDRWLRRCFSVLDLRRSRAHRAPGSRVCAPLREILPRSGAARPVPARRGRS